MNAKDLPEDIVSMLQTIGDEVYKLNISLYILENLYSDENYPLLHRASEGFFRHVMESLVESLILGACRLTDNDKASVTLKQLLYTKELQAKFGDEYESCRLKCVPLKMARNKHHGHLDKKTAKEALRDMYSPLYNQAKNSLRDAIKSITALSNDLAEELGFGPVSEHFVAYLSGVDSLVGFLMRGARS